jgi:hypothetical protein
LADGAEAWRDPTDSFSTCAGASAPRAGAAKRPLRSPARTGGAVHGRPSETALILSRYTAAARVLYFMRGSVSFDTPYCCAPAQTGSAAACRLAAPTRTATNLLSPSFPPACIIFSCCGDHESIVTDLRQVAAREPAADTHTPRRPAQAQRAASKPCGCAPHKADVHAQAAVHAAALEAHEDAVGHGRPLRVARVAVDAGLRSAGARRERPASRRAVGAGADGARPPPRALFSARDCSSRSTCAAWPLAIVQQAASDTDLLPKTAGSAARACCSCGAAAAATKRRATQRLGKADAS